MKILYHHRIASKDGQYVHIEELINAFKALGHEIIMVGPSTVAKEQFGSEGGIIKVLKKYVPRFIYELAELSYSLYAYYKLSNAIRRYRPDVIYERYNLYLPAGIWAKEKYKLPLLLEVNAPLFDERSKYDGIAIPWLARWSEQYCWKNADHVLPVTHVLARRVFEEKVPKNKVTVIPNGINVNAFSHSISSNEAKIKLGLSGKVVLGFTGFVREWHGLERVLDLLVGNKNIFLLMVGDGPAVKGIRDKAKYLDVFDQIKVTGVIERNDIVNYVSAFDIALQPDVVDYASPLKMFEYMFLGKAIVAPDKDNIREILENNNNAILFAEGDFVDSIKRLLADESMRKNIGENARKTIFTKNLTWENNANTVVSVFNNLLETV